MLNLRSWSQEHPKEPVIVLVTLCAVLAAYVHMASPAPHYDPSTQVKYTEAKTLPTAGPLPVEASVQGRRVKPVALALTDDSGQPPWTDKFARRDDGYGYCPANSHYHATKKELESAGFIVFAEDGVMLDGKCHKDDNTDAPVEGTDRKKLPKPNFHPDPNSVWL